jgi:hypothetical protein
MPFFFPQRAEHLQVHVYRDPAPCKDKKIEIRIPVWFPSFELILLIFISELNLIVDF